MEDGSGKPAGALPPEELEPLASDTTRQELGTSVDWGLDSSQPRDQSWAGTDVNSSSSTIVTSSTVTVTSTGVASEKVSSVPFTTTQNSPISYARIVSPPTSRPPPPSRRRHSPAVNRSESLRHARTFIVRRGPPSMSCTDVIKTVSDQFRMPPSALFERVLRDPKDRRRFYLTFVSFTLKCMVEETGFKLGTVVIKPTDGTVHGYVPFPPYYIDIATLNSLISQSGQLVSSSFVCTADGIRIAGYQFQLKPRQDAMPPRELVYGDCTMAVRYADDRRQCSFCGGYGHTLKYCRKNSTFTSSSSPPLNPSALSQPTPSVHGDHSQTATVEKRDDVYHGLRKEIIAVQNNYQKERAEVIASYWNTNELLYELRNDLCRQIRSTAHPTEYLHLLDQGVTTLKSELRAEFSESFKYTASKATDALQPLLEQIRLQDAAYPDPVINDAYDFIDDGEVYEVFPVETAVPIRQEHRRRLDALLIQSIRNTYPTWQSANSDGTVHLVPKADAAPPDMEVDKSITRAEPTDDGPPAAGPSCLQSIRPQSVLHQDTSLTPDLVLLRQRAEDVDPVVASEFCIDMSFTKQFSLPQHFREPILSRYKKAQKKYAFTPYGITFVPTEDYRGARVYLLDDTHRKFFTAILQKEMPNLPLDSEPCHLRNSDYVAEDDDHPT